MHKAHSCPIILDFIWHIYIFYNCHCSYYQVIKLYLCIWIGRDAEDKKEHGNQLYIVKNYKAALVQYTAAINLCPDKSSYYGNRAACYLMLGQYKNGLEDARRAVALDLSFVKGYVRIAKCCLALGLFPFFENFNMSFDCLVSSVIPSM